MVRWWQKQPEAEAAQKRSWYSKAVRRLVRVVLAAAMWLVLVAALLAGGLLASGSMRETLVRTGLKAAEKFVPGAISVGELAWPQLGHLHLLDVVWTDGQSPPDTLAHVALLDLHWDVVALRSRDVRVDSLALVVPQVNVPAIDVLLQGFAQAAPDSSLAVEEADSTGTVILRDGPIPGIPSLALGKMRVEVGSAVLTADMELSDLVCDGAFEAGYGHQGRLTVEHLELQFATSAFDTLLGHRLEVSLPHLGLGMTLVDSGDQAANGDQFSAVMDSLSLSFDFGGIADGVPEDRARAWWKAAGPGSLKNTARITRTDGIFEGRYDCVFVLPGALETTSFMPVDFPHAEYGQVNGRFSLEGQYGQSVFDFLLDVDLANTTWLDTGRLTARAEANLNDLVATGIKAATVELDTLDFSLLGAGVRAGGSFRQGDLDLGLRVAVSDTHLATILRPEDWVDSSANLDLEVSVGGTLSDPAVNLALTGGFESPLYSLPDVVLNINGDQDGGDIDLLLADGFAFDAMVVDSLATRIHLNRSDGDSLSGAFSLGVWRGADRIAVGGLAWADSLGRAGGRRVQLDSLIVAARGQRMALEQPTTLSLGPGPWDLELTPLVFAGEPGEISMGGLMAAAGLDLESQADFYLSEAVLNLILPLEFWSGDGGRDLSLAANMNLNGTREDPELAGYVSARILPHRDDLVLGADINFSVAGGDTAGLYAAMAIVANDSVVLGGHLEVPGGWNAETAEWTHAPGRPSQLVVPRQELGLANLNRMLPPEVSVAGAISVGLQARIPLAEATSAADSVTVGDDGHYLAGEMTAPNLEIQLPNRSRLSLELGVEVTGTIMEPVVGGRITVKSGFFRIPEIPRSLLPVEGEPLLWSLASPDTIDGLADSLQVFERVAAEGPVVEAGGPGFLPEMDLEILIPSNLRIHGYGLDVELAGNMKVGRGFDEDDHPQLKIRGDVQTVHGTLQFMNRVFDVQRGEIRFTGAVPPDPDLDMTLETNVSGTFVRILVSGTASNPIIEMNSEPDYEEQDIMAVLLFGRPLSELDNDQRGGVQNENSAGQELAQNMAGLAMAFGTAGLQNQVSNTFGVDMVEVGADSEGDSTLMVGKYINPKLMVKYHHSLEKSGTYYLTMEYALSQVLKVVSTYAQGEEDSGLELKWSRRY